MPFLFVTGYGSGLREPRDRDVPVITKPYGARQIAAGLAELAGRAEAM